MFQTEKEVTQAWPAEWQLGAITHDLLPVSGLAGKLAADKITTSTRIAAYSPFGEVYAQAGLSDESFTGMDQSTVTNMYDFPTREPDIIQSNWLSPDPAGLASVDPTDPHLEPLRLCPQLPADDDRLYRDGQHHIWRALWLPQLSISGGYNFPLPVGGQVQVNSSGVAEGPTIGEPGASVAVTDSACVRPPF